MGLMVRVLKPGG